MIVIVSGRASQSSAANLTRVQATNHICEKDTPAKSRRPNVIYPRPCNLVQLQTPTLKIIPSLLYASFQAPKPGLTGQNIQARMPVMSRLICTPSARLSQRKTDNQGDDQLERSKDLQTAAKSSNRTRLGRRRPKPSNQRSLSPGDAREPQYVSGSVCSRFN
jgi:hypothetical protein